MKINYHQLLMISSTAPWRYYSYLTIIYLYCIYIYYCIIIQDKHSILYIYSQTRMKETHWAVRKGFLLSIVSFISCPINVESLTCIKAEE